MHKSFKCIALMMMLALLLTYSSNAQDTKKKVVVNPDGSYSVIEYPVDKEVVVRLLPMNGISSTGTARVLRTADGTKVYFDVAGAPADWKNVYAYAVDPTGAATLLGPITFTNGVGRGEFTTPNSQFMLVLSPSEGLTAYDATTAYVFRSEAPSGYAIVPRVVTTTTTKTVVSPDAAAITYDVPMLGMPKFNGKTTEVKVKFAGELDGLEAKASLKPDGGKTQVRMRFADMKKVPANKRFILWASGPEGYTKIGQVVNTGRRDESEIRGEIALSDFGLFLTVEDVDVDRPTSRIYSTFTVVSL